MKFDHLKKLDISRRTAWMELPEVSPQAKLQLAPANDSNPSYWNARFKSSGRTAQEIARTGNVTPDMVATIRDEDKKLFPRHVVKGWSGIEDTDGKPVPFSGPNCAEFIAALPNYIFDRIRNRAEKPETFLDEDEIAPDPTELAGNSGGGSSSS